MRLIKQKTSINFLSTGRRRAAVAVSVVLVVASLISLALRGLDFGIDFTGGLLLEVAYDGTANLDGIRNDLAADGIEGAQVQLFGSDDVVLVRLPPQDGEDNREIRQRLESVLGNEADFREIRRVESVSPQVGRELRDDGALALLFTLLLTFAYIMFRFQWKFAAGAVAALAHDAIFTVGFFSWFHLPFDLTVIAALLAVIGYSLNDTVVVFDRIRENFLALRGVEAEESMNRSINDTLSRTLITGLTTLLVLVALLLLGGESIVPFSIALIVGIVVGTYSSIYVASAIALMLGISARDLLEPVKGSEEIDDLP